MMAVNEERIDRTYNRLGEAEIALAEAAQAEIDAEYALQEVMFPELLRGKEGLLNGKNEQEREAQSRIAFPEQHKALRQAQARTRGKRLTHRLETLAVEMLRMEMRLLELSKPAGDNQVDGLEVISPAEDQFPF